jgi:hypothetical protein
MDSKELDSKDIIPSTEWKAWSHFTIRLSGHSLRHDTGTLQYEHAD